MAIPRRHLLVLMGLALVFTLVVSYLCEVRLENFFDGAFDLGVSQQMLWTTSHGYLLYETPDRMFSGTNSYLAIHTTYISLVVAPLYTAFPYPLTLFALQSAAIASSVFPLYLLVRRQTHETWLLFVPVMLFLVNFGVLSALLFDFHWEAFLPAEFLWFYLLVRHRRYLLSLAPAVAGFLTLEIFPFLVGALVVLLLYEKVREVGIQPRVLLQDREVRIQLGILLLAATAFLLLRTVEFDVIPPLVGSPSSAGHLVGPSESFGFLATSQTILPSLLYWALLLAALGFLPIFSPKTLILSLPWFIESVFLQPNFSYAFGNQYALVAMATLSVGLVEGTLAFSRKLTDLPRSYALMGALSTAAIASNVLAFDFSPLLLSGVVGLPIWLALLSSPFIALIGLYLPWRAHSSKVAPSLTNRASHLKLLGLLLGLAVLSDLLLFDFSSVLLAGYIEPSAYLILLIPPLCAGVIFLVSSAGPEAPNKTLGNALGSRTSRGRVPTPPFWLGIMVILVAFNVGMSPLVAQNFEAGAGTEGYRLLLTPNPSAAFMGWIVGYIPPNAVVLTTTNLFPFVANNPNAWSTGSCLLGTCALPPYLPFNGTRLPDFVLTDSVNWGMFPAGVQSALTNTSAYGLVAYIVSQSFETGSIYLFEEGYRGASTGRYATPPPPPYFGTASNLTTGASGVILPSSRSQFGRVIETRAPNVSTENPTLVWSSPELELPAGLYHLVYNLTGTSQYSLSRPDAPVLRVSLTPESSLMAPTYLSADITAAELDDSSWGSVELSVPIEPPFQLVQAQAYLVYTNGQPNGNVTLNYLELDPY